MGRLDREFQLVLEKISDKLSSAEVKSMRFLLGHSESPVTKQALENVKVGHDVFELMMKHGLLSKINTEYLVEILNDNKVCIELLQTYNTNNKEELAAACEGPCNIKDDMVVEHFKKSSKLAELQQRLENNKFVTITGLLGCGKSQLALWYGTMFRQKHKRGLCWRFSCQSNVTLLNSHKKLVDAYGLEKEMTKQSENMEIEQSFDSLRELILQEVRFSDKNQHLIILDDVTDQTKRVCEKLKNSFFTLGIQVVVTTCNSAFCDEEYLMPVEGFTEQEAVEFLQDQKQPNEEEQKSYKELAHRLGYLPLLLYGARTCMRSSRQSPKRFIRYLKGDKSPSEFDRLMRSTSEPSENRELFKGLKSYLEILKEEEGEDVFDMILALQFLGLEDILVLLLDFLPTNKDQNHRGSNTTHFIQAIQKFSFAMIRGEDDDRLLNTHFAVVKTLDHFTSIDDKVRLIKKLLTAFMWLMDKDNHDQIDYQRNNMLLPHAISMLQHVKLLQQERPSLCNDLEFNILAAYVYDVVGYTYNFFGILKNAGEHSTAAKEACFQIIGVKEIEIENLVGETCFRDNNHISWQTFAECEANVIFDKLKDKMTDPNNTELINRMAKLFVLNKYRGRHLIGLLQSYLDADLEDEYILTEKEYQQLQQKNLILPEHQLGGAFLLEVVLQVFYTFGRRIFYLGDGFERKTARNFAHSLFLSNALGKKIANEYPDYSILYVMLTELSGTIELMFEDKADLQCRSLENMEVAGRQLEKLLAHNTTHYNFGLVQSFPDDSRHNHICYKRLVRCYTNMAQLVSYSNDTNRQEIHDKGMIYFEKLNDCQKTYREVIAANLRMAEFLLQLKYYEDAENKFMVVAPEDMIESDEEMKQSLLNNHELKALKGLTKCYAYNGKVHEARSLAQRMENRLEATKEKEELVHYRKLVLDLKLAK